MSWRPLVSQACQRLRLPPLQLMRRRRKILALAALTTAVVMQSGAVSAADDSMPHVLPLKSSEMTAASADLRAVAAIASGADLVGFGEGWHYVHEFLELRNRLFVHMVEHAGVTAYAGETGFERGIVADEVATGRREPSSDAVGAVFYNAVLTENRQLLDWIRAYNARPTTRRPIRFYGIDVSGGRSRAPWPATALEYIERRDTSLARNFEARLRVLRSPLTAVAYSALPTSQRSALTEAIADLVDTFEGMRLEWVAQTSRSEFQRAYRGALVARQADAQRRCDESLRAGRTHQPVACEQLRDAAMAENLGWALGQEGEQGRVFVFAHNWHLDKTGSQTTSTGGGTIRSMGFILNQAFGARYRVIGSLAGAIAGHEFLGNESDALRGLKQLRRAKLPLYVLDLRAARSDEQRLHDSFDAMLFVDQAQPCHGCDPQLAMP